MHVHQPDNNLKKAHNLHIIKNFLFKEILKLRLKQILVLYCINRVFLKVNYWSNIT